jgi:hypothetical protein
MWYSLVWQSGFYQEQVAGGRFGGIYIQLIPCPIDPGQLYQLIAVNGFAGHFSFYSTWLPGY